MITIFEFYAAAWCGQKKTIIKQSALAGRRPHVKHDLLKESTLFGRYVRLGGCEIDMSVRVGRAINKAYPL